LRIVIKVGSHVLTQNGQLAYERIENLCELIAKIKQKGDEILLVSSGAVAAGYTKLPLDKSILKNRQAIAAVGQPYLISTYRSYFSKNGIEVSQLLLGADDFDSRKRCANAKRAVEVLLQNGILPIINENDVTSIDELVFGDNDQLSAHVAYYFDADLLVILSDIDGYYDKDPRSFSDAKMKKVVNSIDREELEQEHTPHSEFATGGIVTKLKAADFLLQRGKRLFLSSGFDLRDAESFLLQNRHEGGTLFEAK
jgi:glutamate 5-kinase